MTEHSKSSQEAAGIDQPIVVVIDDDVSVRRALSNLFQSVGLKVEVFGSAPEMLQSKLPDVPGCLVLDIRLPGLSGLDLQTELADARIHIPIIQPIGVAAGVGGGIPLLRPRLDYTTSGPAPTFDTLHRPDAILLTADVGVGFFFP